MTPLQPASSAAATPREPAQANDAPRGAGIGSNAVSTVAATAAVTSRAVTPAQAKSKSDAPQPATVAQDNAPIGLSPDEDGEIQPVPPLRSFARIPMQIVAEINKLREEAAETKVQGMDGRLDPTPMPASAKAIGSKSETSDATEPREAKPAERPELTLAAKPATAPDILRMQTAEADNAAADPDLLEGTATALDTGSTREPTATETEALRAYAQAKIA